MLQRMSDWTLLGPCNWLLEGNAGPHRPFFLVFDEGLLGTKVRRFHWPAAVSCPPPPLVDCVRSSGRSSSVDPPRMRSPDRDAVASSISARTVSRRRPLGSERNKGFKRFAFDRQLGRQGKPFTSGRTKRELEKETIPVRFNACQSTVLQVRLLPLVFRGAGTATRPTLGSGFFRGSPSLRGKNGRATVARQGRANASQCLVSLQPLPFLAVSRGDAIQNSVPTDSPVPPSPPPASIPIASAGLLALATNRREARSCSSEVCAAV